jgi:hypothetical protein
MLARSNCFEVEFDGGIIYVVFSYTGVRPGYMVHARCLELTLEFEKVRNMEKLNENIPRTRVRKHQDIGPSEKVIMNPVIARIKRSWK